MYGPHRQRALPGKQAPAGHSRAVPEQPDHAQQARPLPLAAGRARAGRLRRSVARVGSVHARRGGDHGAADHPHRHRNQRGRPGQAPKRAGARPRAREFWMSRIAPAKGGRSKTRPPGLRGNRAVARHLNLVRRLGHDLPSRWPRQARTGNGEGGQTGADRDRHRNRGRPGQAPKRAGARPRTRELWLSRIAPGLPLDCPGLPS